MRYQKFTIAVVVVLFANLDLLAQVNVRFPAVQGQFYSADPKELKKDISNYMETCVVKELPGNLRALISPHAGYIYSGGVAASGYRHISQGTNKVLVLAPSHHFYFFNSSILKVEYYENCLGKIRLDEVAANLRKTYSFINDVPDAHSNEHSLEVHIPFLQRHLSEFTLIPIVLGRQDPELLAKALVSIMEKKTVLIASSDLSHYHPYNTAVKMDQNLINSIMLMNIENVSRGSACGLLPILTVMHMAEMLDWKPVLIDYRNSGDTAGNKDRVVGYSSIAFVGQAFDNKESVFDNVPIDSCRPSKYEKSYLLKVARARIDAELNNKTLNLNLPPGSTILSKKLGSFVTLHKDNRLRGCIGTLSPQLSLLNDVYNNAFNSAFRDHRFNKLRKSELAEIDIEVSILTEPKKLEYQNSDELLGKLRPEIDGVILTDSISRSTYLPQVWYQIPDKIQFLEQLSLKSGNIKDWWKEKSTELYVYEAVVFGEKDMGLQ